MAKTYKIPKLPLVIDLETKPILKQLILANKQLAELKGIVQTIPNHGILIDSLTLQEAKDSSEIENIVTTHDDLYKADLLAPKFNIPAAEKEVKKYRQAIRFGFDLVRRDKLLTSNMIKQIHGELIGTETGFRKLPGTVLKDSYGNEIYKPPQDANEVEEYMANLQQFINSFSEEDLDPLIRIAIIHHQFESIHPFYDGNGRTGRIITILLLVMSGLLDLPILYLSRFITHNKVDYYQKLQAIRETDDNTVQWQEWVLFILKGIEETSKNTIILVNGIRTLMSEYKQNLKSLFKNQYNHEMLNTIFSHPYTKVEFLQNSMQISRITATKYLKVMVNANLLEKVKNGRTNYYINTRLCDLFMAQSKT